MSKVVDRNNVLRARARARTCCCEHYVKLATGTWQLAKHAFLMRR